MQMFPVIPPIGSLECPMGLDKEHPVGDDEECPMGVDKEHLWGMVRTPNEQMGFH